MTRPTWRCCSGASVNTSQCKGALSSSPVSPSNVKFTCSLSWQSCHRKLPIYSRPVYKQYAISVSVDQVCKVHSVGEQLCHLAWSMTEGEPQKGHRHLQKREKMSETVTETQIETSSWCNWWSSSHLLHHMESGAMMMLGPLWHGQVKRIPGHLRLRVSIWWPVRPLITRPYLLISVPSADLSLLQAKIHNIFIWKQCHLLWCANWHVSISLQSIWIVCR